jgi:ribosomal-protein-alanine N-acetyltransferase
MPNAQRPQVRLERASLSYAAQFLAAARRSRKLHRPWVSPPITDQGFQSYLAGTSQGSRISYFVFAEPGQLVGVINLNEIVRGQFQSAYLGYYAFAPYQRHGYMTRALSLLLRRAFGAHALHRIEANIQPANAASIALVKRAGFHCEGYSPRYLKIGGRWRDHERWAMTAEDWRRTRKLRGAPLVPASAERHK